MANVYGLFGCRDHFERITRLIRSRSQDATITTTVPKKGRLAGKLAVVDGPGSVEVVVGLIHRQQRQSSKLVVLVLDPAFAPCIREAVRGKPNVEVSEDEAACGELLVAA